MKTFSDSLYDQLQETLREISVEQANSGIRKARESILAIRSAILDLKQFVITYQFSDPAEEIHFFKEIQPDFYCQLIYYIRVLSIESRFPVGSKEDLRHFLGEELKRIHSFFEINLDIYKYYRLEETSMDRQYFLREHLSNHLPSEEGSLLYDNRFCTEIGFKIASIKAYELLRQFLEEKLTELEMGRPIEQHPLKWKSKKVYLVELLYLLHANGVFGNLKLKTIVDAIAPNWNCPISNVYKTIEEIRIRKKERFPFIRQLLNGGERKMDEDDLKAR